MATVLDDLGICRTYAHACFNPAASRVTVPRSITGTMGPLLTLDRFYLEELLETETAKFAAVAALLVPTEGRSDVE
jgi:hypothetical protein